MSTLTYKDLESMVEQINKVAGVEPRPPSFSSLGFGSLFGMPIIEAPRKPKMQLSKDCPVTDDFRREMNAWLIEFFGYESLVPIDTVYMVAGSHFIMRPETVVKLANICA